MPVGGTGITSLLNNKDSFEMGKLKGLSGELSCKPIGDGQGVVRQAILQVDGSFLRKLLIFSLFYVLL